VESGRRCWGGCGNSSGSSTQHQECIRIIPSSEEFNRGSKVPCLLNVVVGVDLCVWLLLLQSMVSCKGGDEHW
jgi:hypothetical protein